MTPDCRDSSWSGDIPLRVMRLSAASALVAALALASVACGASRQTGRIYAIKAPVSFSFSPGSINRGDSVECMNHGLRVLVQVPPRGRGASGGRSYMGVHLVKLTLATRADGTVRGNCVGVVPR